MVTTAPFHAEDAMLADCGLHALARRIDRGRPSDEAAVLLDLSALGYGWAATIRAGGEFRLAAPLARGEWLGTVSRVQGCDPPVLAVRTFVAE
jgi:hypothetical protein